MAVFHRTWRPALLKKSRKNGVYCMSAMTRAKDELDLIIPQRFFTYNQAQWGDRHVYASVSRFIPKSIRHYFDCRTWSDRSASSDKPVRKLTTTVDVAASASRMWR